MTLLKYFAKQNIFTLIFFASLHPNFLPGSKTERNAEITRFLYFREITYAAKSVRRCAVWDCCYKGKIFKLFAKFKNNV